MMAAKSRRKGANGEREVVRILRQLWEECGGNPDYAPFKRNLDQWREGGYDILGLRGYAVEVKRVSRATAGLIRMWWDQARRQAAMVGLKPLLCYREDRGKWVCMTASGSPNGSGVVTREGFDWLKPVIQQQVNEFLKMCDKTE